MQRTGVRTTSAIELLNYFQEIKCIELAGVYTHFAMADEPQNDFSNKQIQAFKTFINEYLSDKLIVCHMANSGGVCYFPDSHLDMVRPGLLSYGYFSPQTNTPLSSIQPFFSVKAKIAYFKVVEAGLGVSYNHTYKTKERTRIVTIPIGYGDGFRRSLSNLGSVLIRGKRYPIVGTVCMDQLMVDIGQDEAYVGDEVVLIGKQGKEEITLNEMATLCQTIPYEILCGFNDRLPRFYY
jgi:alanine racemase